MKKKITRFSVFILVCLTSLSFAGTSDLEIINYSTLENALGDRYARITVKSIATGSRLLESKYFIATLMDSAGTKVEGISGGGGRIMPGETKTVTIFFGNQKWPIANIEVD